MISWRIGSRFLFVGWDGAGGISGVDGISDAGCISGAGCRDAQIGRLYVCVTNFIIGCVPDVGFINNNNPMQMIRLTVSI